MNKKAIKSGLIVVIILLAFLLMPIISMGSVSAEEANANNYIASIRKSYTNGKFEMGLELGIEYDKLNLESGEINTFKERLASSFEEILNYEKDYITQKYNQSEEKLYSPEEDIVFDEIEKGDDYLYYDIIFPSLDAYKFYYSDLKVEREEGFLISSTVVNIKSPFKEEVEEGVTRKDFYLQTIYSAAEGLSIEESIKEDFAPKELFDFVSSKGSYKSNCDGGLIDKEDYYHYIWGASREFDNMTLKLNSANKGWWYLLGISIPLVCMGVCIAVIVIQDKLKKKNKE